MTETPEVRNNREANQYELRVDGKLCIAAYEPRDGALAFTHTEVPQALEGRGLASRLIKAALADVRAQGQKIIPLCEFVAAYLERHPEERDLVATGSPG